MRRSIDQNSLMWARLQEISEQVEWTDMRGNPVKLSPNDWKDILTAGYRTTRVVPGIDPGTCVLLGLHTRDFNKQEMTEFLDLIDAFAAEQGVVFNERWAA